MKKSIIFAAMLVLLIFTGNSLAAEPSIVGVWATTSQKAPNEGKVSSHIEITEQNGVYSGKIVKLFLNPSDTKCEKCPGDRKGKPVLGMTIVTNMKKTGVSGGVPEFGGGKLLDVEGGGREVNCTMWPEGPSKLKLKASIAFISKTLYWTRIQ